jgi:large subunit ribosomal protein L1
MTDIGNGKIDFDKIICTQDHISGLKKFARILGPKGLMPNAKSGTLVRADEIVDSVQQSKMGLVEFRVNPEAFILSKVGLRSFDEDKLEANFDALMTALVDRKPETIKERYGEDIHGPTNESRPKQICRSCFSKYVMMNDL